MSSRLRQAYVAASSIRGRVPRSRARQSEAAAACSSVPSVIIAPEPKTRADERELIPTVSASRSTRHVEHFRSSL